MHSKQHFWLTKRGSEAGFATPAATMVSLTLAIVATAVTVDSLMELRLARSDQTRTIAQYALDGAQQQAALTVLNAKQEARLAWTMSASGQSISALAEPQGAKLTPTAGANLDTATLTKWGVADSETLRARLTSLPAKGASDFAVESADAAALWRACARSLISPYGQAKTPTLTRAAPPITGGQYGRIGETWRIRLATADGWVDDRIVRFTGEAAHPAAVVERRFTRGDKGEAQCENLFLPPPKT